MYPMIDRLHHAAVTCRIQDVRHKAILKEAEVGGQGKEEAKGKEEPKCNNQDERSG